MPNKKQQVYMLDTGICSLLLSKIGREQAVSVIEKLVEISTNNRIVIFAITYAEMRYGFIDK